jgi:SAM-dependent methyltransferase
MAALRSGAAAQFGDRPDAYYDQTRPDIAELVPPDCRRVLEIGCGAGGLGLALKSRGCRVVGVELLPTAADRARERLDEVATADVEAGPLPFAPQSFDAVIFADVLEHLYDPWCVLRDAAGLLAAGGVVVASIPNVQNIDVLWRLARGRWDYRDRGLLDRGHVRFFTLGSIRDLFDRAGLTIARIQRRYRRSWSRRALCWVTVGAAEAYLTRQYLVVARKNRSEPSA